MLKQPVLVSVVFTLAFASAAQAADICEDFYHSVCGDSGEVASDQMARINAVGGPARVAALQAVAAKFGYSQADDDGYDAFEKAHPEQGPAMLDEFHTVIRAQVHAADGFDSTLINGYETRVKQLLFAAIDARPELADAQKEKMKAEVTQVVVLDAGAILIDANADPELLSRAIYQCTQSGLADNAFQPPGTHYVVLCPGLLIASRPPVSQADQDLFAALVWTLSHESSHTMDYGIFPDVYAPLRACIQSDGASGAFPVFPADKMEGYMEEIVADSWASEAMARLLAEYPDVNQGRALLSAAADTLCGTRDDGVRHPVDTFRLEDLTARNPRLREAMGCASEPAGTPYCPAIPGA
jgi:hypothetical protein